MFETHCEIFPKHHFVSSPTLSSMASPCSFVRAMILLISSSGVKQRARIFNKNNSNNINNSNNNNKKESNYYNKLNNYSEEPKKVTHHQKDVQLPLSLGPQ